MATEQPFEHHGNPENTPADMALPGTGLESPAAGTAGQSRNGSPRKARQRSAYPFPAYGFSVALDIARLVEESGGGTLSEETLAVNLGLSKNSSGFRLKCLTARNFNLLVKDGPTVSTTAIAKAILKPTSDEDAMWGHRQSFLSIPLFRAVAERYGEQRLPDRLTLRNVLEREFSVESSRVQQAERLLKESARDTFLLQTRGEGEYLVISDFPSGPLEQEGMRGDSEPGSGEAQFPAMLNGGLRPGVLHQSSTPETNTLLTITYKDLGKLSGEEFGKVWEAMGIVVKARTRNEAVREADRDED